MVRVTSVWLDSYRVDSDVSGCCHQNLVLVLPHHFWWWRCRHLQRLRSPCSHSRWCCHGLWLVGVPSLLTKLVLPVVPVEMAAGTWRVFANTGGSSVTFLWLFGCFPIIEGSCRLIMGDTVLCSHLHGVRQCLEASRGQPLSISVPGALCSFSSHLTDMSGSKERSFFHSSFTFVLVF
ncbi:uncharacterized protein LOC120844533 isoform X2 [Ixodes scapularis]|uniref:uncharacterized protein LOC120844533 isoform X2 n=1 Tax=Ixodes scapularis TaxID=6945 RepID=UPI001A9F6E90|nr:uncharacterized protein LOC120844533 isoform X2 [Ixodes scapularis]